MGKRPTPGERGEMVDMDCQETREYLYAFLDGQLGLKESLEIEAHLSSCPGCQKIVEFEKNFNDLLRE